MALAQVLVAAAQIDAQRTGYQAISLTEFATALEPELAQGSVVEVGGALYEAAADEPITGLAAIAPSSDVYIKLTVAGASVTASGTVVAPTWDTAKQGFYTGAERVIGGLYKDAGGNYTLKWLYEHVGNSNLKLFGDGTVGVWDGLGFLATKVVEIGDWDMDAADTVAVAHGLADPQKIRSIEAMIRTDAGSALYPLSSVNATDSLNGAVTSVLGTHIGLRRIVGETFDNVAFDLTPFNRGWVRIEYEV